jgi:hypothetical protein
MLNVKIFLLVREMKREKRERRRGERGERIYI